VRHGFRPRDLGLVWSGRGGSAVACWCLGCGFPGDLDGVAEGFQVGEVAAGLALAVGLALVPVGAEVVVAGLGDAQEVPVR
jgi:hypothetical protein